MSLLIIQRFGVYHWESFTFEDASTKDKFFIALNCTIGDKVLNLVLPTSQYEKRYENSPYYLMDTVIVEDGLSKYFSKKTVVDLKNIQQIHANKIKIENINYKGILEQNICDAIVNTIKKSKLLSQKKIVELLCESEMIND
jgi:hypothetical protein